MSKSIRSGIITSISLLLMFYLCGATIAWEINPGNWSDVLRAGMSIFGFMLSAFIGGVVATETK